MDENLPLERHNPYALISRKQLSIAAGGKPIDFYAVDWQRVFDDMHWSYMGAIPDDVLKYQRDDGSFDMHSARQDFRGDCMCRYVDKDNKPDIDAICAILDEHMGSVSYVPIFTAIPDPNLLSVEDRNRVEQSLLGHCEWLIGRGALPELFECFEQLFPVWFDSFEIIEERLPKGLRSGYIEKMPHYSKGKIHEREYDNYDEVRAVIEREFPIEEWDELTRDAMGNSDMIFYNRTFRQRWPNGLPLKSETQLQKYTTMLRGKISNIGQARIENQSDE